MYPTGGLFALARSAGPNGNVLVTKALGPWDWTGWDDLGGGTSGSPVAYTTPDGEIAVFSRGVDAGVYLRWARSLGAKFKDWMLLGEPTTGAPSVCTMPDGSIAAAVRGEDYSVLIASAPLLSGPWSGWEDIGGSVLGGPTLFADGPTLAFVARDRGGHMVYASQEEIGSASDFWMPPQEWIVLG